jgi:hypothetical protein
MKVLISINGPCIVEEFKNQHGGLPDSMYNDKKENEKTDHVAPAIKIMDNFYRVYRMQPQI